MHQWDHLSWNNLSRDYFDFVVWLSGTEHLYKESIYISDFLLYLSLFNTSVSNNAVRNTLNCYINNFNVVSLSYFLQSILNLNHFIYHSPLHNLKQIWYEIILNLIKIGSKDQEASPSAGKNTGIVLVPCHPWKCVPTAFLVVWIFSWSLGRE